MKWQWLPSKPSVLRDRRWLVIAVVLAILIAAGL
jgi:hypothetical protein